VNGKEPLTPPSETVFFELDLSLLSNEIARLAEAGCAAVTAPTALDAVSATDVTTSYHLEDPLEATVTKEAETDAGTTATRATTVGIWAALLLERVEAGFVLAVFEARAAPSEHAASAASTTAITHSIGPGTLSVRVDRDVKAVTIASADRHGSSGHGLLSVGLLGVFLLVGHDE